MGRFLIFFSYIGTSYNGLQRQLVNGVTREGTPTIQGAIEEALAVLRPANEVKLVTSSRTDAGVHSLSNSAHFDLQHRQPDREFSPLLITAVLNQTLYRADHDIRILQTRRVSDDFHSRFKALARHYVYRLAVVRNCLVLHWANPVSAMESKRCIMVLPPFDINRLHQSARIFSGSHDFSAYTNPSIMSEQKHLNPVKSVSVGVKRGRPIMFPHQTLMEENLDMWEVHVSANSFLYKQVRRMVGVMLRCAAGEITPEDIQNSFKSPTARGSNFIRQKSAHPYGLYLKSVEYHPADLQAKVPCSQTDEDVYALLKEYNFKVNSKKGPTISKNPGKAEIILPNVNEDLRGDPADSRNLGLSETVQVTETESEACVDFHKEVCNSDLMTSIDIEEVNTNLVEFEKLPLKEEVTK